MRFRLSAGRGVQLFHVSEIEIDPQMWDNKRQEIKPKALCTTEKKNEITLGVANRKSLILKIYSEATDKSGTTSEWLEQEIARRLHPEQYKDDNHDSFFDLFAEFLKTRKYSDWRIKSFNVVIRALKRYELYRRVDSPKYRIELDTVTPDTLSEIDDFLRREYLLFEKYPDIYNAVPESRPPKQRGQNTINGIFTMIRSFYIWANKAGKTRNNPFDNFTIEACVYGTPYYISIDECEQLYRTNLSRHPSLAVQRDIFVFQCLIGCRVGDYLKMTKRNIINGAIEYVASKTRDGRPVTVRVPLGETAKKIVEKYKDCGNRLLPFILPQDYNDAIKLSLSFQAYLCTNFSLRGATTANASMPGKCDV